MSASMRDVAEAAGVSIKTVSNVVNGRQKVGAKTRARVLETMERLDFQHNPMARSLRSGRTGLISVVVPGIDQPYFANLTNSIITEATSLGLRVVVELTGGEPTRELAALGSRSRFTDGTILIPIGLDTTGADHVAVSYPLVVLGEPIPDTGADFVSVQGVEAARAATHLLIERGRRRIAAVGLHPEESAAGESRLRGYLKALEEADVAADPALLVTVKSWHRSAGTEGILALLDYGADFDAVYAFNDALALGVMSGLHARGVAVPAQVAVIGFDDIEEARYSIPTLSSVDPGYRDLAKIAVARLAAKIHGDAVPTSPPPVAFRIIERASTGALPPPRTA